MIDIRLEGHSAVLRPDAQLTLERFSPMFYFDTVPGTRVMEFQLPIDPVNRRILGDPGHHQADSPRRRWRCEQYLSTNRIEIGYVKIREISSEGYKVYFTENLGQVFGDYQDRPLNELTELGNELAPGQPGAVPSAHYVFPRIENLGFFGNAAPMGWDGFVNGANANMARVPMFFLNSVLTRCGQLTGWSFGGTFWNSTVFARMLLYNLNAIDGQTQIVWSNHLPDMTLGGLLIELRKMFNLYIEFDQVRKVIVMDLVDPVLAEDVCVNWTDKALPGGIRTPDTSSRLELSYELDQNDASMKPAPASMLPYRAVETADNAGSALLPVRSKFSTLLSGNTGLPFTNQQGYSTLNKDSKPVMSYRFLLWNGVEGGVDVAKNEYGTVSLLLNHPNSLPARYWPLYERFRSRTILEKKNFMLTPADIASFSFRNRIHNRGVNYMVASLKAAISKQPSILCEAEVYKI